MGLFGRKKEGSIFDSSGSESTLVAQPVEYDEGSESEELVDEDIDWDKRVAEVKSWTHDQLFAEAVDDIANGDAADSEEEASMYYARAAALGQLATYRYSSEQS